MKKIILFVAVAAINFTSYSQALGYEDLALIFSRNDNNGSARFMSMGGAFGALGGDMSAITINPAGISVFNSSHASIAFSSRSTDYTAAYGESTLTRNTITTQNDYFNLSNAGAVFVFHDTNDNEWSKLALGINYRLRADFENTFIASGNEGIA